MILNCIAVGIGGFFGSIFRYLAGFIPIREYTAFPLTTMLINAAGALLIGLICALFSKHSAWDARLLLMLKAGFCGGFTTFSAFSLETLKLLESGAWLTALLYAAASVILCILAVFLGQSIVR